MRKSLIVSALLVAAAFFLLMFGFNAPEEDRPETPRAMLLVVEKDTGAFLMQLRQGVQTAAAEMGWELYTEVASGEGTLDLTPAGRAFSGALLFIESDELRRKAADELNARNIEAVLVGAEDSGHACVETDMKQAAGLAGEFASAYDTVYLLGGSEDQRAAAMAHLADREVLTQLPVDPALAGACVVSLDADMTRSLGQAKAAGAWAQDFVCWNPAEEDRAAWLEDGVAQAIILPLPYAMGYEAARLVMGAEAPRHAASRLVTREDMYSAQNIKLVFPLLH